MSPVRLVSSGLAVVKPPNRLRWYSVRPRFLATISVTVLLLWGAFRHYEAPMGAGPAGPQVPAAPFEQPWSERDVVLLGLGDSIVTGFGAPKGFGFFDLLTRSPEGDEPDMSGKNLRRVLPHLKVLNLAANSTSSGDHLRSEIAALPRQADSVLGIVVLSTGGIDLIHDYGAAPPRDEAIYGASWEVGRALAEKFRARLDQLLDEISKRFPGGSEIFIATIFDPTDGVGDIERANPLLRLVKPLPRWPDGLRIHAAFNDHIRAAAQARAHVHVVDVYSALLGHGLHCRDPKNVHYHEGDPTTWLYFNVEDPNRRGYDAIRRTFLLRMIDVLPGHLPAP
jgi:hypothetical protein